MYKKNYAILDFKDCDDKEKGYNFIKINITKELKKSKIINDAFCEYRFTSKDKSIIYISSDVYRGSRLNYKNLYEIGIDGYYPRKTSISDTIKNEGRDAQNLYWLEYVLGDVVVGYNNVSETNKQKYDTIISSIKRLKKQ
jgi:hypothetical protein